MNAVECCSLMDDDNECSQVPWIPLSGCSRNVFVIVKVSVISMHCEGSKTLIEWNSESMADLRTYGLTGVGPRDACASKKVL